MERRKMLVEKDIHVAAYDIDAVGIVSNIVYVRWFEDLRMAFLDRYYPYDEIMKTGISPILLKTEIEYKSALTIYDKPIGRCWITNMGKSKWEMEFEIVSKDVVHCIGKQTGCFYNIKQKKAAPIPERLVNEYN